MSSSNPLSSTGDSLDGRPGFTYALLQSIYEAFILLKVHELEQQQASAAQP